MDQIHLSQETGFLTLQECCNNSSKVAEVIQKLLRNIAETMDYGRIERARVGRALDQKAKEVKTLFTHEVQEAARP